MERRMLPIRAALKDPNTGSHTQTRRNPQRRNYFELNLPIAGHRTVDDVGLRFSKRFEVNSIPYHTRKYTTVCRYGTTRSLNVGLGLALSMTSQADDTPLSGRAGIKLLL